MTDKASGNYTGEFGGSFTEPPKAKPKQVPSLSRDVHYHQQMPDGTVSNLAAKVVKIFPDGAGGVSCVNLCVFNDGYCTPVPGDDSHYQSWTQFSVCEATEYGQPGRWSWPPFVAPK